MAGLGDMWRKLSSGERMAVAGAVVIIAGWLLGLVMSRYFGLAGAGGVSLLGAIAMVVVVYLRYAPNSTITWPAPYPVILFGIGAIVGVLALLTLLDVIQWLGLASAVLGVGFLVPLILYFVGAGLMAFGSYQVWQLSRRTA